MKKKLPNSVFTIVLTAITVVSWVFFSIYQTLKKPLPVVVPPEITQPVDPNVGLDAAEKLKNKKYFEEGSFKETEIIKPSPTNLINEATSSTQIQSRETPTPTSQPIQ